MDYGLPPYDAGVLVADKDTADYFEAAAGHGGATRDAKQVANWIIGDVAAGSGPFNLYSYGGIIFLGSLGWAGFPTKMEWWNSMPAACTVPRGAPVQSGACVISRT